MWKKILISFFVLISILSILGGIGIQYFNSMWFEERPNYVAFDKDSISFPFSFQSRSYGQIHEAHDIIIVPIRLEGIAQSFYLQWDSGSPHSLIYRNPLNSLKALGYNWQEAEGFLLDFEIAIGNAMLAADSFPIYEDYGRNFELKDSLTLIKLGTLGADIMEDKISIIDFEKGSIGIYRHKPEWMNSLDKFEPFSFAGRRIMLPAVLTGKKHELFYDSGSSAFGLITSKGRFEKYSRAAEREIRYEANSWGRRIPICHKETQLIMYMGEAELPLIRVSYIDMYTPIQDLLAPFSRIGGWLGNKAFLDSKLILDCQKEEFLVLE